jgi:two-component system, OmpR family, sensor kinase
MSLRLRLTLLLAGAVAAALLLAWIVTGRAVIAPFVHEVMEVYLDQAVFVAERVAAGEDPEVLGKRLGLEIKVRDKPFFQPGRVGQWRRKHCEHDRRGGHELVWCRGPRAPVSVETPAGWVTLKRDLDVARPRERNSQLLLLILAVVIGAGAWVAHLATRPLRATQQAMARIAEGDLAHRLPVTGAKELAEAAASFNKMAERVDEMLKAERALMAGISHELRTPLARLRLELEILRDHGLPEKRLTAMEKDVEEIDALIGELLESSRLTIGERSIVKDEVDLEAVVAEAKARPSLAERRVEVEGHADPVIGDRARLVRVVANLLDNAAKYAPPDQPIEVKIEGRSVEVRDSGPGVPESELGRLFEPFYRGGGSAARRGPGLGLGLMIAEQVITLHGGSIRAENRAGGGLSVRFTLPAQPAIHDH